MKRFKDYKVNEGYDYEEEPDDLEADKKSFAFTYEDMFDAFVAGDTEGMRNGDDLDKEDFDDWFEDWFNDKYKLGENYDYEEEPDNSDDLVFELTFPDEFPRRGEGGNARDGYYEFRIEDGGDAWIASVSNNSFGVDMTSYDEIEGHEIMRNFLGKKVKITIETLD